MACSITFVIFTAGASSMRCALQRPHAPACLAYAGTSAAAQARVVIYLAIDKKLTNTNVLAPARAYSAYGETKMSKTQGF